MQFQTLQWAMDINGDGTLSLWEIWETVRWAFHLPGNLVLEFLGQFPTLASLLHIHASPAMGYASLDGLVVKALSLLFWVPALMWLMSRGSAPAQKPTKAIAQEAPLLLSMPDDYPIKLR